LFPASAPPARVSAAPAALPRALEWTLVVSGGALVVAGIAGIVWSNGVNGAVNQQSSAPTAPLTVTRAGYEQAVTVNHLAIGAALVGAAAAGVGTVLWLRSPPPQVAVVPIRGGAAVSWGASF
jgi:hypothetical protein